MDLYELSREDLIEYIKTKVSEYENSSAFSNAQVGLDYYKGKQLIDSKLRLGIGEGGKLVPILNVPNYRIKDNQYAKLVDQKVNYLFTKKPAVSSEDERFQEKFGSFIDMKLLRTLNKTAYQAYNCGIAWWYLSLDEEGKELTYKLMSSREIIPLWQDVHREKLQAVIRRYSKEEWDSAKKKIKNRAYLELYTEREVMLFDVTSNKYELIDNVSYIRKADSAYSWNKIPFVYFKGNDIEQPLIMRVKSLQDGINAIMSNFVDNIQEDPRSTIMVLKGYDGQDLGEFRHNLSQFGAVKVIPGEGDVGTLEVKVNSENYKAILSLLKEKLIENGRGLDAKNDKTGNQPNELNIKSMYSEIELDANKIELEFQASFEYLQDFYKKVHRVTTEDYCQVNFKRNIMVNEESLVQMIRNSEGIISKKTQIENHPLVTDTDKELQQLELEQEEEREEFMDYNNAFEGADIDDEKPTEVLGE